MTRVRFFRTIMYCHAFNPNSGVRRCRCSSSDARLRFGNSVFGSVIFDCSREGII